MTLNRSIQLQRLVLTVLLQDGSPNLVRALVLGGAVVDRSADPQVEIADRLESIDQRLGRQVVAGAFDGLGENGGVDIAFQRGKARMPVRLVLLQVLAEFRDER